MKRNSLTNINSLACIVFCAGTFLNACGDRGKNIRIKGNVVDEGTNMQIPMRNIIVQGIAASNKKSVTVNIGQFQSDSSGSFTYLLRKIKDAVYYNFCFVGDSDYAAVTTKLTLPDLEKNAKHLSFPLSKLVDFTIKIYRKSTSPVYDTLYLSWDSDGVDGRILYPCKIDNYGENEYFGKPSALEFKWIGGTVRSTIKTRAFADKKTKVSWWLVRSGKRKEITDTITCRRGIKNCIYLTY